MSLSQAQAWMQTDDLLAIMSSPRRLPELLTWLQAAHLALCRSGKPPGYPYGEDCLFVANDWHAALVPAFVAAKYRRNGVYKNARSVLAIHNMSHQGVEPANLYGNLGLPEDW